MAQPAQAAPDSMFFRVEVYAPVISVVGLGVAVGLISYFVTRKRKPKAATVASFGARNKMRL